MHTSRVPSLSLAVAKPIITALHFVLCVEDVFGEPRGNGIELEEQMQCGVESKIKSKIEYAYNTMRW